MGAGWKRGVNSPVSSRNCFRHVRYRSRISLKLRPGRDLDDLFVEFVRRAEPSANTTGATLRNMRQPCSSPKTSIIKVQVAAHDANAFVKARFGQQFAGFDK